MRHKLVSLGLLCLSATLLAEMAMPNGSGSGFFITSDGFFLTNYHVVKGAERIQIRVGDTSSEAKLVKSDPANDIAVLKADGQFVSLPIGPASGVSIGDDVFTVGFPAPLIEGFAPKLTKGNVNAASGLQDDPRFFQISIPVQPGNSGGPLVDERGNVVGIVTSTLSPTVALSAGFIPQNVNFAVKTAYALPLIEGIPELSAKLPHPITESSKTPSQMREETQKAVGLVLVFTSVKTERQTEPNGLHRENPPANTATHVVIAQAPYNLGQAIFNGTYKFGKAKVNHVPEKAHRLGILQPGLPEAEQKHFNPRELAGHLNDREMNALEYYIHVKYEKYVTVAPSWAKEEPPIKVINSK